MKFIPGLKLSATFFEEAIQPLMADKFPNLVYSAARLGWGSDVLGFDTPMSMDHGWGPKMTLFLRERDYQDHHQEMDEMFAHHLPFESHGFPTHFGEPLQDGGRMALKESAPIHHMVSLTTPERWFKDYLGVDIHQHLDPVTWLTLPQQRLRTVRAGRIYHDGLERLVDIRERFHWYPHDLWLYLMANQWQRIDQDEPFMGRTGQVGDELGSRLIAGRLIGDLMRLAFLMERQYSPYHKWFGTAFAQLELSSELTAIFHAVLDSRDWKERESHLTRAYLLMAEAHNKLGITPVIVPELSDFHQRPFLVLQSSRFVTALLAQMTDPAVKALPPHLGGVDQISDNTDVLDEVERCRKLSVLYQGSEKSE